MIYVIILRAIFCINLQVIRSLEAGSELVAFLVPESPQEIMLLPAIQFLRFTPPTQNAF